MGKSKFIVCGSTCDDLLHQKPYCPSCGVTEIKWSDETRIDPDYLRNIPSMQKFFQAFGKFNNVSAETKERRERDGLTLEEVTEWEAVMEHPAVKDARSYLAKPPPQVRDAPCKQCGKHVFPVRVLTRAGILG